MFGTPGVRILVGGSVVVAALLFLAGQLEAAAAPQVVSYAEGAVPGTFARTVTVFGSALNKIESADIVGPSPQTTSNPVGVLGTAKTSATFTLPSALTPGDYTLRMVDKRGGIYPVNVRLSLGSAIVTSVPASAITGPINATTLGGNPASSFVRTTGASMSGPLAIANPSYCLTATSSTAGQVTAGVHNTATTGASFALVGDVDSDTSGAAIAGASLSTQGYGVGVFGYSYSQYGVGVYGSTNAVLATGVVGYNSATSGGPAVGVLGVSASPTGVAVEAIESAGGDALYAVSSTGRAGVFNTTGLAANSTASLLEVFRTASDLRFKIRADGNVYCDGSFNGGGADVAERISIAGAVEPGDLVEIDPEHPQRFRLSSSRASTLAAGVISSDPGLVMGNRPRENDGVQPKGSKEAALALAGRAPVKVCDENGPVKIGDLLVASSRPGYAMRAGTEPAPGTVVGKALEPLAGKDGKVAALLMLR